MSSLSFNAFLSPAFQEKPRTLGKLHNVNIEAYVLQTSLADGAGEVRDPLAIASPSFDWADDAEQEFHSGFSPDLDNGDGDSVAGSPESARFFLSISRENGCSLATRLEEDGMGAGEGVGSHSITTDSAGARGLLDLDRMFASSCPPREYRVASVPSLCAIQEDDEESEDDFGSTPSDATSLHLDPSAPSASNSDFAIDSPTEHFDPIAHDVDSLLSSLTCVVTADEGGKGLAADDPNPSWVWLEAEDIYKEARAVPMRTKARRSRLRAPSWFRHLCDLGGIRVSPR